MPDDHDRPSTETEATPRPPTGENIKALVTPGDDASEEAEAETDANGSDEIGNDIPRPEEADEARSPT